MLPVKSVIRLGSISEVPDSVSNGGDVIEINTIEAIKNSASKLLMKNCFMSVGVPTAEWFTFNEKGEFLKHVGIDKTQVVRPEKLPVPIVAKGIFGSRGTSNYKFDSILELKEFLDKRKNDHGKFIFEKYYSYTREYRLHVTSEGCFYTCRKMLRRDAPAEGAWQRHDDNCTWFLETNPKFDKPVNWDEIVGACVKALNSTKLDVASFDVRVQSASDPKTQKVREKCEFIIIECNSASSFGDKPAESIVASKYLEMFPKLILKKAKELQKIPQ